MKILGIDSGTNSLGWTIRDTDNVENQFVDYGVVTFDKGVATVKGVEFPKVLKRTESRGKRNNYRAEKYRKWELLKFLIENKMCPLSLEELDNWRKYKKGQKRKYPQSSEFINWIRFDFNSDGKPDFHLIGKNKHESLFAFRALAIDPGYYEVFRNNTYLLGRILYQLVQRRGFKGRDEEEAETILQGSEKNRTEGRNAIAEYIDKYKTLGAALYFFQKENGGRIRQRYNLRKDYENELKILCNIYGFNETQYQKLWKAIIWQRPLRTQKGLVGYCIYEKNKKRVQVSHPLYEEYRIWTFINNLKIIPPKGIQWEKYVLEKVYPLFYKSSNDFELRVILNQLKKDGGNIGSNFNEKTKVISAKLLKLFQDIFGDDWQEILKWNSQQAREKQAKKKVKDGYTYEDIWHVLQTFDSQDHLKEFAIRKLNLNEITAEKFSKIKLNAGYATLSLSAIKKILPFLKKGIPYHYAVFLANMYKVLGMQNLTDEMVEYFIQQFSIIEKQNNKIRILNTVINSLILDELNSEHRYAIENGRSLDESEERIVQKKLLNHIGEKTWDNLSEEEQEEYFNYVAFHFEEFLKKPILNKSDLFLNTPKIYDLIFTDLVEKYDIPLERKKLLWHPSDQEIYEPAKEYDCFKVDNKLLFIPQEERETYLSKNPQAKYLGKSFKLLGSPEPITKGLKNPMALKTLHKLKQLINFLIQSEKIDEDTRIVLEIARDLNDANRRKALEEWNREREKENKKFREKIIEINDECGSNYDPNDKVLIQKVRLWHEQNGMCLYTGKIINCRDLFDGNKYDLEHTIPASVSFDNELKNLSLADTEFNRKIKKKQLPSQLPNYSQILINVQFMKDKIEHFEKLFKEWKNKASYASTKEIKDKCIQKYHYIKMELDYWSYKYNTFVIEEYKSSWRNSQLKDTQIISKYALHYLKTLFKKVTVEKGEVVNKFKEIYKVKLRGETKDRKLHSHHAIDAAILTLIPSAFDRERILKLYNEELDNRTGKIYHENPKDWKNFSPVYIKEIENNILINNLTEHRTTKKTFKTVRKRGKIVWKDREKGIRRIAKGDTIRGQLHDESFYGAIKLPLRDNENKILFDINGRMKLSEEPILVIRKELVYKKDNNSPGFKSLDEIQKVIVDKDLFEMIKFQVEAVGDFKVALENGIWMLDKQGQLVNKIRRIRCIESLNYNKAIRVHEHSYKSKFNYKNYTLAKNGENALCLFYKSEAGRAMEILSISDLAHLKVNNDKFFFTEPEFNKKIIGKGKNRIEIPLYAVLKVGQKVLFFHDKLEELKELGLNELSKRLYKVYQFEGDGRLKFRHHLIAGIDSDLKKEYGEGSYFNFENPSKFLRISKDHWNFAIDGVDFEMNFDGIIHFNK